MYYARLIIMKLKQEVRLRKLLKPSREHA